MDQPIGTLTRILQIRLPSDPAPRFAGWGSALTEQGYRVDESMLFDGRLLFSAKDVESGQIAILPESRGTGTSRTGAPESQPGYPRCAPRGAGDRVSGHGRLMDKKPCLKPPMAPPAQQPPSGFVHERQLQTTRQLHLVRGGSVAQPLLRRNTSA
jgi:hypothetical protein